MPVITHRRVNEMRSSRRRLSVGAFGTYSASTFSFSRNGMARSPAASKEYVEHKPGTLERRSSVRSIESSFATHAHSSAGESSAPTSPQLQSFVHSGQRRPLRITPPPTEDIQLMDLGASSNCSQDSLVEPVQHSPSATHTSLVDSPGTLVDDTTASNGSLDFSGAGALVGSKAIATATQYAASAGQINGGLRSHRGGSDEALQLSSGSYDEGYAIDSDYEVESADDEDMRNEPLPTPEQLILSQSWSTWPTPCHHLYSGSRFAGTQSNGTRSYTVTVALKYVDMGVPELCGHFTIRGLTNELPKLTTYFDAQIIGAASNSFITNQWDATIDTDRTHWSLFPAFKPYRGKFDCSDFAYRLRLSDRY
ncbi:hypothetical protein GGI22_006155, partial [Coemansia erecta]